MNDVHDYFRKLSVLRLRAFAILATGAFLLSGCLAMPKPKEESLAKAAELEKLGRSSLIAGDYSDAKEKLILARDEITNQGKLKSGAGLYFKNEASISAMLGHIDFLQGNLDGAAQFWQESFSADFNGTSEAHKIEKRWALIKDAFSNVLSAAVAKASAPKNSKYYSYETQNTIVAKPELLQIGEATGTVRRVPVRREYYPFDSIVRLRNSRGTYCTATMISPWIAVTAAHCISDKDEVRTPEALTLHRESIAGTEVYEVERFYTHKGENEGWDTAIPTNDWAVLITKSKFLKNSPFPAMRRLVPSGVNSEQKLMLAGYSGDLSKGFYLTLHHGCEKKQLTASEFFLTTCETAKGSSGSSVMSASPPYAIVGVHRGILLEPKDEFSSYEVSSKDFFDVASRELAKKRFDN